MPGSSLEDSGTLVSPEIHSRPRTFSAAEHSDLCLYPLTSTQREIWFDQLLNPQVPLYNVGGWVHLSGPIDVERFRAAVQVLVQRHDALRMVLVEGGDESGLPLQRFVEPWTVAMSLHDVSAEADPRATAQAWMQARFQEPFTLIGQPLWRYDLVRIGEAEYGWLLQYHHLMVDGWGIGVLGRSLAEIYTRLCETAQLPWGEVEAAPSSTAFIAEDRAYVESAAFAHDREYWREQYPNAPPEPLLQPRLRGRARQVLVGSAVQTMHLPRSMYRELEALAHDLGARAFHLWVAALYVYFTRTAQRDDFAIGLPVLNRSRAQMRATAGLFVGMTPARLQLGRELSTAELTQQIGRALKGYYRHQRYPIREINRAVGLAASRSALFDVTLSYENSNNVVRFGQTDGQGIRLHSPWEQAPLAVSVQDYRAAEQRAGRPQPPGAADRSARARESRCEI